MMEWLGCGAVNIGWLLWRVIIFGIRLGRPVSWVDLSVWF